jgi:DNA-binding response OmpR family regulator
MEPRTDQKTERRWLLVVDGDVQIRRLLELSLRNAGFDVRTVATAAEALTAVGERRPDLIVSEARLEGGPDGYELCRQIKKRSDGASIAFIFLAAQTIEAKLRGVEAGADDFLAKPLYVQEVVAHARSLLQRRERDRLEALAGGDERFMGDLEDFPLVDLLRALEANHKSGVVVLATPGGARGEIYFRDGTVVDAEVGRLSGLDAVCRLFSWNQGRFEIDWKNIRRKDAVAMEPGTLLMEALRRLDEWRRLLADLPAQDTIFEVDYHLLAERLAEIPDEVNAILRLFDGQRTFIHVIDDCGLSDLDALAVVGKLHREQIIRDARAKPDMVVTAGADIEGWLTEAAGPFRAPPSWPRRELFGASPEAPASVHGRATAPIEPLEEAGQKAIVEERRERFTDRLIAEGATVPVPATAPPPRAPVMAAETTQQGLGAPAPALSTRPGFAAVTPPAAPAQRMARQVLTDVTPSVRDAPVGLPGQAEGIPQPLLPQSPEPAIVIPLVAGTTAPRLGTAPPTVADLSAISAEQLPVAGEILARRPTAKLIELPAPPSLDAPVKRITDLGLGPEGSRAAGGRVIDDRAFAPTAAAGEVVAGPARVEEARPARKIILDPEIPEDEAEHAGGSSRWVRPLGVAAGFALAAAVVVIAFKNTGHKRHHDEDVVAAAPATRPVVTPIPHEEASPGTTGAGGAPGTSGAGLDGTGAHGAVAAHVADARHAAPGMHEAASPVLDERLADPKVARALPREFPQLLAACRQAFTEKRAKDAETACIASKDANPDSAEACALLGHALFNRKKKREALQWAERAVELDAKQADAYVIVGSVKQAADDAAAAKAAYKKYLELAPNGQYAADLRAIVDSL